MSTFSRMCTLAAVVIALAVSGQALAQGLPISGTVALVLTPSTTAPLPGTNFTVDLKIDLTGETGTCTGGVTVPMTLGAYNIGITYDNTKLTYVSVASCGTVPQFVNPNCNDLGTIVNCNDGNTGNSSNPQGLVCVARLTFTNVSATLASPTSLGTIHTPSPRGVSSNLVTGTCNAGPATVPAANITDGTVASITPASLISFDAE